jgi:hypothetical protein
MTIDANGNIFTAEGGNNRIRRVDAVTGIITTVAGNGTAGFSGRRYEELPHPSAQVGAVLEDASFHPGRTGRNHLRVLAAAAAAAGRGERAAALDILESIRAQSPQTRIILLTSDDRPGDARRYRHRSFWSSPFSMSAFFVCGGSFSPIAGVQCPPRRTRRTSSASEYLVRSDLSRGPCSCANRASIDFTSILLAAVSSLDHLCRGFHPLERCEPPRPDPPPSGSALGA